MRLREIEHRRKELEKKIDAIRSLATVPSDEELLLLKYAGWDRLRLPVPDRMLLSAWIRLKAREENGSFALVGAKTRGRERDEKAALRVYGYPSGDGLVRVQQLVGVLWDLVPYCEDNLVRAEIISNLWPQKGEFQQQVWSEVEDLAAELAGVSQIHSGLDYEVLPEWLRPSEAIDEEDRTEEAVATHVAEVILGKKARKNEDPPAAVFLNEKIRAFYGVFGMSGIKRLAKSDRLSVALTITTDFRTFQSRDHELERVKNLLNQTEDLVRYLLDEGDISTEHLHGGPFSARVEDLDGIVMSSTALERFSLNKTREYEERCASVGPPRSEDTIISLRNIWDEIFAGMPTLIDLVNNHLYPSRYGCVVEGGLWPLPRRHRIGAKFVEDDERQLAEDTLAEVFAVGCDALSRDGTSPELLRAWLALWLGALRPKESGVIRSDLVPFAGGYLQVIAREVGKSGHREAYWPESGVKVLNLTPKHFSKSRPGNGANSKEIAEQAWRIARQAWKDYRHANPKRHLPEIPDRLAYVSRKTIADIIRWNGQAPLVVTKVLGHETETSDLAYTQISRSEYAQLHKDLSRRIDELVGIESQEGTI